MYIWRPCRQLFFNTLSDCKKWEVKISSILREWKAFTLSIRREFLMGDNWRKWWSDRVYDANRPVMYARTYKPTSAPRAYDSPISRQFRGSFVRHIYRFHDHRTWPFVKQYRRTQTEYVHSPAPASPLSPLSLLWSRAGLFLGIWNRGGGGGIVFLLGGYF